VAGTNGRGGGSSAGGTAAHVTMIAFAAARGGRSCHQTTGRMRAASHRLVSVVAAASMPTIPK
jgi:hypothetical protein